MGQLTLKERMSWAIKYVIRTHSLSNVKLGLVLDVNKDTISSYRKGTTNPNANFISIFCRKFKFNSAWFLDGKGEPFDGARKILADVCGPKDVVYKEEKQIFHSKDFPAPDYIDAKKQPSKADLMAMAARVLESDTMYEVALAMNIRSFYRAIENENRMNDMEKRLALIEEEMKTCRAEAAASEELKKEGVM